MAYIKFKDKEIPVRGTVKIVADNLIRIESNEEPNESGFFLYLDRDMRIPMSKEEYENYTTLYRQGEGWYELSNDGTVYVEPLPPVPVIKFTINSDQGTLVGLAEQEVERYEDIQVPVVEAAENYEFKGWNPEVLTEGEIASDISYSAVMEYIPTIEDLRVEKIKEVESCKEAIISLGFDVTLADGTVEHFNLSNEDQLYLTALNTLVLAGTDPIPWHVSDETVACKNYSNSDMGLIVHTALGIITYHITYLKDIERYINSITSKEEMNEVTYGMMIPEEFQSQPLKDMMAQLNA